MNNTNKKKKYRIANKRRFITFVTLVILSFVVITGSAMGCFSASSMDAIKYTTVEVKYGDTLWNLARKYGNTNKDVREVIYEICKLNNVSAETLQAGQFITIPN